jgi:hypothetical protein
MSDGVMEGSKILRLYLGVILQRKLFLNRTKKNERKEYY